MKWWAEVTEWRDGTRNGIYLLDDSKSKMYAYRPTAQAPIKVFRAPIRIETRGRRFQVNPVQYRTNLKEEQPQGRTWTVTGSRGDSYKVNEVQGSWSCTCSGFKFRGDCRHIKDVKNA